MAALALALAIALCALVAVALLRRRKLERRLEAACSAIEAFMDGDRSARLEGSEEGELSRLFASVNSMATALSALLDREKRGREELKDTIADISHQLKTPLAALRMYGELMAEERGDPEAVGRFAAFSLAELDRMEGLVLGLLTLARLDSGSISLALAEADLEALLSDAVGRFAPRAAAEGKTISLDCPEGVALRCDEAWLGEALGNVIKNALDHTGPGGRISVSCELGALMTRVAIRDNGSGIGPEDIHHIWKRFYRSRYAQDRRGIGIGLAIARALAERQGGTLAVESQLGSGSAFYFSFPRLTKP